MLTNDEIEEWLKNLEEEIFTLKQRLNGLSMKSIFNPVTGNTYPVKEQSSKQRTINNIEVEFIKEITVFIENRYMEKYDEKGNSWEFTNFDKLVDLYITERAELDNELKMMPLDITRTKSEILDSILFLIFMYSCRSTLHNLSSIRE